MGLRYKNNIAPYNQENRKWGAGVGGGGLDGLSGMNIALHSEGKKDGRERGGGREREWIGWFIDEQYCSSQ